MPENETGDDRTTIDPDPRDVERSRQREDREPSNESKLAARLRGGPDDNDGSGGSDARRRDGDGDRTGDFGRRSSDGLPRSETPSQPPSLLRSALGGLGLATMGVIIGVLGTMLFMEMRDDDPADQAAPTTTAPGAVEPITATPGAGPILAAYATRQDNLDHWDSTIQLQNKIGRDLQVIRVFERWDSVFPREFHTNFRDRGQTIILSVRARTKDGGEIRWRDIANAQPGDELYGDLIRWVDNVSNFGAPVLFTFHHEADAINDNPDNGSPDDFIAAWRRIVDEFRARDASNVEFVVNFTGGAFSAGGDRSADRWYPGDDYVDRISADLYNWYGCRDGFRGGTWRSLAELAKPVLAFSDKHPDKPLMLSEFGSAEDPNDPNRKAQWFDEARELFKQPGYERFETISYFNSHHGAGSECAWFVDSSPESLAAFQRLAADPFYR